MWDLAILLGFLGTKPFAKVSVTMVCALLAGYSVIMFMIPFSRDGWFWSGYGFSVLAMLLTLVISFRVAVSKNEYRHHSGLKGYLSMPLAWLYLVIQLVLGTLEVTLHFVPYQVGIVINIFLFGVFISGIAIAKFIFKG